MTNNRDRNTKKYVWGRQYIDSTYIDFISPAFIARAFNAQMYLHFDQ